MSTGGDFRAPSPRVERATVTTDANGNAVFNWPAGAFTAAPVVTVGVQGGTAFRSHTTARWRKPSSTRRPGSSSSNRRRRSPRRTDYHEYRL